MSVVETEAGVVFDDAQALTGTVRSGVKNAIRLGRRDRHSGIFQREQGEWWYVMPRVKSSEL